MPRTAKPFSVRMTNFGKTGWVSDQSGYRYQAAHPVTGEPWPDIPDTILSIWRKLLPDASDPDACLCNFYGADAKMGLHQDSDERDLSQPVLSVSLGDAARFRVGGMARTDKTQSFRLSSGDVFILKGEDRLAFHGVDRIYPGSSTLLPNGGRINLTLRKAL
jgi:alkylated DNA repair protein (DNA oxidative demethylase)